MSQVECVLFDVDDTLCTYRRSTGEVLGMAFDAVGVSPFFDVEAYLSRYGEFAAETDTIEALRRECFATIASERDRDPALGRAVAEAFAAERDHANVRPLPGLRDALAALEDHRLGVVTNGSPEMQAAKLEALDLVEVFDVIVHAGYDAPAKPAPDPFHLALEGLSGTPERAVHVGDSLPADVAGAQAAGLRAAWIRRDDHPPDPEPDFTIDSLADLATLPWR